MYPPNQYARLPQNPHDEEQSTVLPHLKYALSAKKVLRRPRLIVMLIVVIAVATLVFLGRNSFWRQWKATVVPATPPTPTPTPTPLFADGIFSFNESSRPAYMDHPVKSPLSMRIAIMTRRDEFERRQAMRQSMFEGKYVDLHFEYKFFMGEADPSGQSGATSERIEKEMASYADIIMLKDIVDSLNTLSVKRYHAFEWAGEAAKETYDYFLTIDSDTFCRLAVMHRDLAHNFADKNLKPREQPILIARMGVHHTYWQNTVPDDNKDPKIEDEKIIGPWFSYPIGVGYMLSSSLVSTILSAAPSLPHHIDYPSDDVMIGAWVAGLFYFLDPSQEFKNINETSPELEHSIRPRPYLPQIIETEVLNETTWHDFPWTTDMSRKIGWDSVCIHRTKVEQMVAFTNLSVMAETLPGEEIMSLLTVM